MAIRWRALVVALVACAASAAAGPATKGKASHNPADLAWGTVTGSGALVNFALNDPGVFHQWGIAQEIFLGGVEFDTSGTFTTLYGINGVATVAGIWAYDTATGAETPVGTGTAFAAEAFQDMATDPLTGQMYVAGCASNTSTSSLYTLTLTVNGATRIGPITNAECIVGLAIHPGTGQMYGSDSLTGNLVAIDKATGAGTVVGPMVGNAMVNGMDFDDSDGTLYAFVLNHAPIQGELRTVDIATGATTLVGPFPAQTIKAAIAAPGPSALSIGDTSVLEGNLGTGPQALFPVTLSPPSAAIVTVQFDSVDGTATVGDFDYLPLSGLLTFAAGETSKFVSIDVVGDVTFEHDETYFVSLSNAVGASILDGVGNGLILNDDVLLASSTRDELAHASRETRDLYFPRFWRISQKPHSSYEVVIDAATGDIGAGGPDLLRLDSDGTTVLQSGTSTTGGSSKSLRFENPGNGANDGQFIQVRSAGCSSACETSDTVRVRAYDTTYRITRFNNSATQVTVLVIANPTDQGVSGTAWFWDGAGMLLAGQAVSLPPHGTFVLNTATLAVLQGEAGSVTFSNDAPFEALTGKAVSVEPATGFTFDTPMLPR